MDFDSSTKFISSLAKFLQSLCNGYVEFDNGVEVIGHIYLNVDTGKKIDYILNEKVCKTDENSVTFISNSFHAQPAEKPKPASKAGRPSDQEKPLEAVESHEDDIVILEEADMKSDPSIQAPNSTAKPHRPVSAPKRSHHQSFPHKSRPSPAKHSRLNPSVHNPNGAHETDSVNSDPSNPSSNFLGAQSIPTDSSSAAEPDMSRLSQVFPQTCGNSTNPSAPGVQNIKQEPAAGTNEFDANVKQEFDTTAHGDEDQMYDDQDQSGYGGMYDEEYYGGAPGDPNKHYGQGGDYYPGAPGPSGQPGGGDSTGQGWPREDTCPVHGCRAHHGFDRHRFKNHWREKHEKNVLTFKCVLCLRTSKRRRDLVKHVHNVHHYQQVPQELVDSVFSPNHHYCDPHPYTLEQILESMPY